MNPIEKLQADLAKRFPDLEMEIDAPDDPLGPWHLDVRPGGDRPWVAIEWKPSLGFGVSTPDGDDFGTKPDEILPNARAAYDRSVRLILSGGRTEPPAAVKLAELRRLRRLSQSEVAERAGVKQAAVARVEGRGDIRLSTLHRIVSAMGGTLAMRVDFPDGSSRELAGLVPAPPRPAPPADAPPS